MLKVLKRVIEVAGILTFLCYVLFGFEIKDIPSMWSSCKWEVLLTNDFPVKQKTIDEKETTKDFVPYSGRALSIWNGAFGSQTYTIGRRDDLDTSLVLTGGPWTHVSDPRGGNSSNDLLFREISLPPQTTGTILFLSPRESSSPLLGADTIVRPQTGSIGTPFVSSDYQLAIAILVAFGLGVLAGRFGPRGLSL